jgi:hypothetical protein
MDDITRLKKQVKLLTIGLITLSVVTLVLLIVLPNRLKADSWPDLTVGKLTAKEIQIVSPGGERRIYLTAEEGNGVIAIRDEAGKFTILVTAQPTGAIIRLGEDSEKGNKNDQLLLVNSGILLGSESQPRVGVYASSSEGPRLLLQDGDGYSTSIGRTPVINKQDGTTSFTSAASIVGSSKELTSQWPLLRPVTAAK